MKDFYLAINDSDCDKFNFWKKWLIMNIAILKPLCKFANLHAYVLRDLITAHMDCNRFYCDELDIVLKHTQTL